MCSDSTTCFCDGDETDRALYCPECGEQLDAHEDRRGNGCIYCQLCPTCGETVAACEGLGGDDCGRESRVYKDVAKAIGKAELSWRIGT